MTDSFHEPPVPEKSSKKAEQTAERIRGKISTDCVAIDIYPHTVLFFFYTSRILRWFIDTQCRPEERGEGPFPSKMP